MKFRSAFVSNSSSSSFIIRTTNGGCEWHMKIYDTGFEEKPDCIQFSIAKVDRNGMPCMEREKILKLQSLFRDEKFSRIPKFVGSEGITTDGKTSFLYEDGGCFFMRLYGEDRQLVDEIRRIVG